MTRRSIEGGSGSHPTMEDVARAAGVSRALVSLVFRDSPKVSIERRERVVEAARQLGYRPNAMARHLASHTTRTIGVLMNDLHNPFFADIYDGIDDAASALGYRLLLTAARHRDGSESSALDTMLEHRVDAMVLLSPRLAASSIVTTSKQTPMVVVGRAVRANGVDSVMADEAHGALIVVQHLASLGHRQIVHIDGGDGAGAAARREGYESAMEQLGLGPSDVVPGDFTELSGVAAATELLRRDRLPTAIFAANDLVAAGAMDTLAGADVRVPDDVSIVGFDNTAVARLAHVALTTVDQPRLEMGAMAIRLLDERISGRRARPVTNLMRPTLVERRTTAPPRPDR